MATESKTKVLLRNVRLSYTNIWEPKEDKSGNLKYSVSLIIDKENKRAITDIKKAIEAAKIEGKSKIANSKGAIPNNLKTPLRDGDEDRPDDEAYAGSYFVNANSKRKPGIVDKHVQPIIDQEEVYAGCYANVSVVFYAFSKEGNKGIACGLGNIQKIKDGERLAGGSSASEDFDDLGEDEDDFMD